MPTKDDGVNRTFEGGATRDTTEGKIDMEGFTHPMVMKQFAKYMNMNRMQSNGELRDSDNWQNGIPKKVYIKSMKRHFDDVWAEHRGFPSDNGLIASLCGLMFNAMGYLYEVLKDRGMKLQDFDGDEPTPEMQGRLDRIKLESATSRPDPEYWGTSLLAYRKIHGSSRKLTKVPLGDTGHNEGYDYPKDPKQHRILDSAPTCYVHEKGLLSCANVGDQHCSRNSNPPDDCPHKFRDDN